MNSSRGFSLIELMISVAIGLLAIVFVTRVVFNFEATRSGGLGGSESMQSGAISLMSIESEIAQAGWGLNDEQVFGCPAIFNDAAGYQLTDVGGGVRPLAPVVIGFNANPAGPDSISVYSGVANGGSASSDLAANIAPGASTVLVKGFAYGVRNEDVIVIAPFSGTDPCVVAQVSQVTPDASTTRIDLGGRFGSAVPVAISALSNPNDKRLTRVFNLGNLAVFGRNEPSRLPFHTWSVQNGNLMLRAADLENAAALPQVAVNGIVSIKAMYGMTSAVVPGVSTKYYTQEMPVAQWSRAQPATKAEWQRVAAVRIAVVTRSRDPEKVGAGGDCEATTTRPIVFSKVMPPGTNNVATNVDVAVTGDTIPWQCYRYQVFETIVPVRNSHFRPTEDTP